MKIYVGNLPYSIEDNELRQHFEPYGEVISAEVVYDRRRNRSRGYGFVEMSDHDDALEAIEALDGKELDGRALRIDQSRPRSEQPDRQRNAQQRGPRRATNSAPQPSRPGGHATEHSSDSYQLRRNPHPPTPRVGELEQKTGLIGFFKRLFS